MEFPDVHGVYDYAGPPNSSRCRCWACGLPRSVQRRRPDCKFSKLDTQPILSPVYASLDTSQRPAQNSGPSGSLLLSREALSSSIPCRFIPAHVAVGMPVAQHPPHRSPRAALPHEALILDEWRQSELGDMDGEHAAGGSTDQPSFASAPKSGDVSGPDESTWSARAGSPGSEMRTDYRCFPAPHGS